MRASQILISESGSVKYIGVAPSNVGTDEAAWSILRIDETTDPTTIMFADGDTKSVHVWDDRATLDYG